MPEQASLPCFYRRDKSEKKGKIIIFVHGVFSNLSDTWGEVKRGNAWPQLVKGDDNFTDFDIFLINYPTTYLTSAQMIHEIAIREMDRLKDSDEFDQYKEIYFIAHSMGGLVVKSLLTHLNRGDDAAAILRRVKASIYLGTPSQGSILALIGSHLSFNPQLGDMAPISQNAWLSDLEKHWNLLMNDRKELYPRAFCAYETIRYPKIGIFIVPQENAASRCDDVPIGLPFDHSDLAVPMSRNHDPYVWAMKKILKTSRDVTRQNIPTAQVPIEPEEMPIYIECGPKLFPKTVPSDWKVKQLVFTHRAAVSLSNDSFQSIGIPGSRTQWSDLLGKNVSVCQITNYGTVPVLNVHITFGLRFKDTVWLNSKGNFTHGPTKVSDGWTSRIHKLDPWPSERFMFTMNNATNDWLEVSIPELIELQPLGKSKSRTVPLLRSDYGPSEDGDSHTPQSEFMFSPADWPRRHPAD